MSMARLFVTKEDETTFDSAKAADLADSFFKDWYMPIDKESFVAVMEQYERNVPAEFKPAYYMEQIQKYGNAAAWADAMFGTSLFADEARVRALTAENKDTVFNDPAFVFFNEFLKWYSTDVQPHTTRLNRELDLAYRDYMRGQMDFAAATEGPAGREAFYPDANLTLRVAYGHIKGYSPADGVYYTPSSTIKGIMEKDNPDIFDYNIPQRLREVYATKDYGRWADASGEVPVCFIATNHTTGGNSGSPVINADGDLIGLNFDRVWEGTMSDIVFDPEICRNIALDVRYVLFTIEKIGGADYLFDEMVFVD